jgi:hypothetical protein
VADVLATTFFCYFKVPRELYCTQGQNNPCKKCYNVSESAIHPPHLCIHSNGMVESYVMQWRRI